MTKIVNGIAITEANRFSRFFRDAHDLDGWLRHFQQHGIPSVVVLTDDGFALYRDGMQDIVDDVD